MLKRNETETDKLLSVMAAKQNDQLWEKSQNDYQQLVQSKQKLNQMIIKASKEHTIKNFSTVENERQDHLQQIYEVY